MNNFQINGKSFSLVSPFWFQARFQATKELFAWHLFHFQYINCSDTALKHFGVAKYQPDYKAAKHSNKTI